MAWSGSLPPRRARPWWSAPPRAPSAAHSRTYPVPDRHGQNLFTSDTQLHGLLALYLPPDLLRHMQPHFERLGALAGGRLDALAQVADQNPPRLEHRTRTGIDA